ncbi:MAG: hypothetical protein ACYCW6_13545 [Candidatus Xenobia bacterium]
MLLVVMAVLAPWARAADPGKFDVLMVIDGSQPSQVAAEHDLRTRLESSRTLHKLTENQLPIDTYDVNVPGQKVAVERLQIPTWQLPFLGLAQLSSSDGLPEKVLFGGGPVTRMEETVKATMQQACSLLHVGDTATRVAPRPPGTNVAILVVQGNDNQDDVVTRLLEDVRQECVRTGHPLQLFRWYLARAPRLAARGVRPEDTPMLAVVWLRKGNVERVLYRLANVKPGGNGPHDVVAHAVQDL